MFEVQPLILSNEPHWCCGVSEPAPNPQKVFPMVTNLWVLPVHAVNLGRDLLFVVVPDRDLHGRDLAPGFMATQQIIIQARTE